LFFELGRAYRWQKDYEEAEKFLEKAIELDKNKENIWAYIEMGRNYNNLGRKEEAENMLKAALHIDKNSQWAYFELGIPNRDIKRLELDNPALQYNYQKIAEEIIGRKIKLVSVQYPLRKVQSLKNMLNPYIDKVIFVDNETPFKKAIMKDEYEKYFSDRFAGDFGHCTREGNKLLAESIANAILGQY